MIMAIQRTITASLLASNLLQESNGKLRIGLIHFITLYDHILVVERAVRECWHVGDPMPPDST